MMDLLSNLRVFDPATDSMAAVVIFTFAAVFFFIIGISSYLKTRIAVKRRAMGGTAQGTAFDPEGYEKGLRFRSQSLLETSAILGDVERGAAKNESEASKIRRELQRAGFFGQRAVLWYQSVRTLLLPIAGLSGYLAHSYFYPDAPTKSHIVAAALAAAIGFLVPSRFVSVRKKRLIQQCREGFPDFIDLMIVCAEAGLGPRAAIDRLGREIARTNPILGAHVYLASLEIRAGSSLHKALFNLAQRTKVDEAATLAGLLEQTEQLGTSVTDSLRVYRDEMRERRVIAAEEKAHSLPAKLVLPMGIFVFPVIVIVIILPAIIRMRSF
jgi:tight adherence protein C